MQKIKKYLLFTVLVISILIIINFVFDLNKNKIDDTVKKDNTTTEKNLKSQILNSVDEIYTSCVPEELTYAISYIQPGAEINLEDTSEIYEYSDLVIVGNIKEKIGGYMLEELGYAGLKGSMTVDKVLKGNLSEKEVEFFTSGGYCTIEEYVESISKVSKEKIERMGFDKLSENVRKNNYLVFNYKYGKNFEVEKRYVLMLKKINNKYICLSNYGFLEINQNEIINDLSDILNI